jgi:hypothetical protein
MFVDPEFEKLVKLYCQDRQTFYMKKIITTVALALAAISGAHGGIGDNPFQPAAHFKTKPIVVEQMTPRTIKVVYVEDGWITVVTRIIAAIRTDCPFPVFE